jgi:peptide subunit release factor 1 (eRF1)
VFDRADVERLRNTGTGDAPVLSVYLGLDPDLGAFRPAPARLKALVRPAREMAERMGGTAGRSLAADVDTVLGLGGDPQAGHGLGVFLCRAMGLDERLVIPIPVRDRAVVDASPYLGPLEAVLGHLHRFCAVVIDRRTASIYRFWMGQLEAWEVLGEEEVRKDNYGGFSGYAEQRVRGRAGTIARRLFKAAAGRVATLARAGEFDLLMVGGTPRNSSAFLDEVPSDVPVAGVFAIDPRTATPMDVRDRCRDVAAAHDRRVDRGMVTELMDAAGSGARAVLGLDRVLDAVNQRAVDRLVVNAMETVPGVVCTECGWLMRDGRACPACGSALRSAPDLIDAAAEAARSDGGSVRYVVGESPITLAQVGAFTRFEVSRL